MISPGTAGFATLDGKNMSVEVAHTNEALNIFFIATFHIHDLIPHETA